MSDSGIQVAPNRTLISEAVRSLGWTFSNAAIGTLRASANSSLPAARSFSCTARLVASFLRTFPDRNSSAVTSGNCFRSKKSGL